jgi:hypothetical protein
VYFRTKTIDLIKLNYAQGTTKELRKLNLSSAFTH